MTNLESFNAFRNRFPLINNNFKCLNQQSWKFLLIGWNLWHAKVYSCTYKYSTKLSQKMPLLQYFNVFINQNLVIMKMSELVSKQKWHSIVKNLKFNPDSYNTFFDLSKIILWFLFYFKPFFNSSGIELYSIRYRTAICLHRM